MKRKPWTQLKEAFLLTDPAVHALNGCTVYPDLENVLTHIPPQMSDDGSRLQDLQKWPANISIKSI